MPPKKADKVPRRARRRARARPIGPDAKIVAITVLLLAIGVAWLTSIRPGSPERSALPLNGGGTTVGLPAHNDGPFPASRAAIPTPFEANRPIRLDNGLVLETDPIGISLRDDDDSFVSSRLRLPSSLAARATPFEEPPGRLWWWPSTRTSIIPRRGSSTTSSSSTSSSTSTAPPSTPSTTRPSTSSTSSTSSTTSSTTTTTEPTTTTAQPTTTNPSTSTTGPPASTSSTTAR